MHLSLLLILSYHDTCSETVHANSLLVHEGSVYGKTKARINTVGERVSNKKTPDSGCRV